MFLQLKIIVNKVFLFDTHEHICSMYTISEMMNKVRFLFQHLNLKSHSDHRLMYSNVVF